MRKSLLAILFLMTLPAAAHHVGYEVDRGEAVVVSLAYGNGSPLAFDRYEIIAEGEEAPYQSGITDAMGRIVFLPDRTSTWRVRVFSEDGHGADFTFEAGPAEPAAAGPDREPVNTLMPEVVEAENKRLVERFAGPVFGVGIILSAFALFSLFARRRR
jgi:nickel transport protein